MKMFLLLIFAFTLMVALIACADGNGDNPDAYTANDPRTQGNAPEQAPELTPEPTPEVTPEVTPEPTPEPTPAPQDIAGLATALVMSYNIYYLDVEHRVQPIFDLILKTDPDVIGFQEVSVRWVQPLRDFKENHGYNSYGYGRHGSGLNDDDMSSNEEFAIIFWKADKYDLIEAGHFWASSTPDVPRSSSWVDGTTTNFARCINWVRLSDRETGREMVFINCHLAPFQENAMVRNHSVSLMVEEMRRFVDAGIPVMMMGDFNFQLDSTAYEILTNRHGYLDVRFIAPVTTLKGTYNEWGNRTSDRYAMIDYFFATPNVIAEFFEVVDCRVINGDILSDHYPILTRIFF